jgi:hypothetical protein
MWTVALSAVSLVALSGCDGPNLLRRMNNFWSWGCCSGIVVILDVIALVEVFGSDRKRGDKILWTVLIIVFPILGCGLYYFFGRK